MADVLDLDWGNSRIKWRCGAAAGSVATSDWQELPELRVDRVRLSRVGGTDSDDEIHGALTRRYGVAVERAVTTSALAGVVCGYDEPASMGVDRWLALIAAWREFGRALVVADFGTAITVDFVDADGQHEGGYIVPGIGLARSALNQQTRANRGGRKQRPGSASAGPFHRPSGGKWCGQNGK